MVFDSLFPDPLSCLTVQNTPGEGREVRDQEDRGCVLYLEQGTWNEMSRQEESVSASR